MKIFRYPTSPVSLSFLCKQGDMVVNGKLGGRVTQGVVVRGKIFGNECRKQKGNEEILCSVLTSNSFVHRREISNHIVMCFPLKGNVSESYSHILLCSV
ncbi:hypothetical protein CEXT_184401 [Caerostris extrusa]|uniref:Uncharacterized protein n=1 Tax=Caerostris extrusa TaxID=172846 RepID=A0AAV4V4W6_CAEEX|nr:hypothetical protein CEXT_184401 [Caerostris extrusa]